MRRLLFLVGSAMTVLLVLAPASSAGESVGQGNWAGSALNSGPTSVALSSYTLSGTFRHSPDRQIAISVAATPAGTGPCAITPVSVPAANTPKAFSATLSIPCNGTYSLTATASTTQNSVLFPYDSVTLDRSVDVSAPAPTVTGVVADVSNRTVTVTWDDMTVVAPDVSGYVVERNTSGTTYAVVAELDADVQSYVDKNLPDAGGVAKYRVKSTRPSPAGDKVSAASDTASATYSASPSTTTTTAPGSSTTTPGDGSGSTDSGGDGSATPTTAGSTGSSKAAGTTAAPRVYSGTFLPPLLRPASQTLSPPTTADTGYEEALPYQDRPKEAVLPGESLASIDTSAQGGRGLVIPVATALVLAIWAVHLRLLARGARPIS